MTSAAFARVSRWRLQESIDSHFTVHVGGCALVDGGQRVLYEDTENEDDSGQSRLFLLPLQMMSMKDDCHRPTVVYIDTHGRMPSVCYAAAAHLGNKIFVFGGNSSGSGWRSTVYELCLSDLVWRETGVTGERPTPRDKTAHWTWNNSLYCWGGFGPAVGRCDARVAWLRGGHWLSLDDENGWNNQLVRWDRTAWHLVRYSGDVPSPRAAAACCATGDEVFVFGGRSGDARLNDLYRLCLHTLVWRRVLGASLAHQVPVGRSFATLDALPDSSRLLLWGGMGNDDSDGNAPTLSDAWTYDQKTREWRRERDGLHRKEHSSIIVDGMFAVIGGATSAIYDRRHPQLPLLETRRVQPASLQRCAFDALPSAKDLGPLLPKPWMEHWRMREVLRGGGKIDKNSIADIVLASSF